MKTSEIASFAELAKHLTLVQMGSRGVPLRYNRGQCDQVLEPLGFTKSPPSYVEYFTHIGYVIWECESDSLGISPPDPRTNHGIHGRVAELTACQAALGLTNADMARLVPFGAIDNGTLMCWDRARVNERGDPAIVRVSERRQEDWGRDLFDFLVNHWLTGWFVHGSNQEIPEENLRVVVLPDC